MKYTVKALASLRHYLPGHDEIIEVQTGDTLTIEDILLLCGIPDSEIMHIKVGDRIVDNDYILQEGDRVEIFPVLSGG